MGRIETRDALFKLVFEYSLLKEKNEDLLMSYGFTNFAISGHTEGNKFSPWQMFDKSRYTLVKGKTK